MQSEQLTALEGILNRWGLPVVMLGVVCYIVWRIARWAEPLARMLVNRHVDFVDSMDAKMDDLSSKTDQTNRLLGEISSKLERRP